MDVWQGRKYTSVNYTQKNKHSSLLTEGSEFSSYEIELRNRVTQNDVTLPVTNSKI